MLPPLELLVPLLVVLPQERFQVDGKQIGEWRILLYSRTKRDVIGDTDFYAAMRVLVTGGYILDDNGENVLIQALTLTELDALMRQAASAGKSGSAD